MKRKSVLYSVSVAAFFCGRALAGETIGTIHTLHVNSAIGRAYVQLEGLPYFDGGGCSSYWTNNLTSDEPFMKTVWPLLLTAKASGTPVKIYTTGCQDGWPKIVGVDLEPRVAGT